MKATQLYSAPGQILTCPGLDAVLGRDEVAIHHLPYLPDHHHHRHLHHFKYHHLSCDIMMKSSSPSSDDILQRLTKPSSWSAQWIGTQTQGKQWHCWWLWHWWWLWNWWFIFIFLRNCRWNLDYEVSHDRPILWLFSILRCDGRPLQFLKTIFIKIIIIIMVAFYKNTLYLEQKFNRLLYYHFKNTLYLKQKLNHHDDYQGAVILKIVWRALIEFHPAIQVRQKLTGRRS